MRLAALATVLLLALACAPAAALAQHRKIAPPGNSGVSQYLENVPTAGGNTPAGGQGAGADGSHDSLLSSSDREALESQGPAGRAAAQLAAETAPATQDSTPKKARHHSRGAASGKRGGETDGVAGNNRRGPLPAGGDSAASSIAGAVAGGGGGMGIALPIVLAAIALLAALLAVLRRRRAG